MKQKIIQHIQNLIDRHEDDNLCTSCEWYLNTISEDEKMSFTATYDLAYYETLKNLLIDIKNMEE